MNDSLSINVFWICQFRIYPFLGLVKFDRERKHSRPFTSLSDEDGVQHYCLIKSI